MGLQVASALEYLHSRGMAHGDLKPSNILAIGDSIKLSSESVDEGDRTADIRALGFTLIHALTQRAQPLARGDVKPLADLPAPFEEIAKGCLNPDPKHLWTASEIVARLRSPEHAGSSLPTSPPQVGKHAMARPRLLRIAGPATVVAAGLLVVAGVVMRRTDAPSPPAVDRRLPLAAVAPGPVPPAPAAAPKTVAPVQPKERAKSTRDRLVIEDGVTRRVTPNIPQKARDTIQGKPAVVVRVTADPMGNVTEAALDRSFSPYFSNFALQAARQWKFVPKEGASAREWILRFQFTPTNTQVLVERAVRE
jgi:TonB family protein